MNGRVGFGGGIRDVRAHEVPDHHKGRKQV